MAAKKRISQKEQMDNLVALMKKWQKIEDATIKVTGKVIKETKNPMIKIINEIINNDSKMHKKVQQFIIDSYTKKAVTLQPEELAEIWDGITKHVEMEKETIVLGEDARRNCKSFIQLNLLTYLLDEEKLHVRILEQLEGFKNRIYPYM